MLLCLSVMFAAVINAQHSVTCFQSTAQQASLIELYTSEGCSSCPPAEAWLTGLKNSPGLWKEFVPLAFHVDYWDSLGWRDPWATGQFSDRQRAYAKRWHGDSIYTPAFVLNGKEWRGWADGKDAPKTSGANAGTLTVSSPDTTHWRASFTPAHASGTGFEAHAAWLASGLSSDVKAGENRGRRLSHDFAVLALADAPLARDGKEARGDFILAPPRTAAGSRLALAVWITQTGCLEPLQATGGWVCPARSGAVSGQPPGNYGSSTAR
jgi:hypothetical protein